MIRIPDPGARVSTGPVQFGDDWPGVFIRGDEAAHMAAMLRSGSTFYTLSQEVRETYLARVCELLLSSQTDDRSPADHAALHREFIARYPRIRVSLANDERTDIK